MGLFRNRELKIECIIDAAATVLLAVAGFFVHPLAGVLLLLLGGGLSALHLLHGHRRYANIDALTKSIDRVLHEQDQLLITESDEGELAILTAEIRKMTVRLREQTDRLKDDKRLLSDAIADLFHQIRTPLTSMNLIVSMLSEEDLPPERRLRYLHELKQQLGRIQWITETLLKLSKLDAETVRFHPEPVDARALIEQAAEPLRVRMELKDVALEIEDDGARLTVDRAWTEEALSNILKNCMEHTPEGGRITVQTEESPVFCRITVRDTGAGFDPEDLGHIFERFYRGKNAADDSIGIGLALSREVIAAQGGTIVAKNADTGGAQFTITFYKTVL
ncbi:MAG: HAMP domain-containing histidine kinase [Clostridia bacterium]|nr:HAMP domain-containing histidine kinase [Clostridia bacterium]